MEQWFVRITTFADRLLSDLEKVDWPESTKMGQRNWIGKKEGITMTYDVVDGREKIHCWTSRPDTNFGATVIVLGPEHPFARSLSASQEAADVHRYIAQSKGRSQK